MSPVVKSGCRGGVAVGQAGGTATAKEGNTFNMETTAHAPLYLYLHWLFVLQTLKN